MELLDTVVSYNLCQRLGEYSIVLYCECVSVCVCEGVRVCRGEIDLRDSLNNALSLLASNNSH